MNRLEKDTLVVRSDAVTLTLHRSGDVTVFDGTEVVRLPPQTLAILEAFREPCALEAGLAAVPVAGAAGFVALSHAAIRLLELGLLVASTGEPGSRSSGDRWATPEVHVRMLRDEARTEAFREAIRRRVVPGGIVLDVGTGSGVLATFAARAGARKVYAVESSSIADAAERIVAGAGLADRVEIVRGRSFSVSLPERASLLVTETIGNDPLSEHILEIVADARKRLLTPDAGVIPERIDLFAVVCDSGEAARASRAFTPENLASLRAAYDIDFGPLAEGDPRFVEDYVDVTGTRALTRLSEPTLVASVDLGGTVVPRVEASASLSITRAGVADALLLYFRLGLGAGVDLDTDPATASVRQHWRYPVHLCDPGFAVAPGACVVARYVHALGRSVVSFARG